MKRIAPKTRSASKQIAEMAIPQVAVAPNWPCMETQSTLSGLEVSSMQAEVRMYSPTKSIETGLKVGILCTPFTLEAPSDGCFEFAPHKLLVIVHSCGFP